MKPTQTEAKPRPRCCKILFKGFSRWQCNLKATGMNGGKHYCTIHHPDYLAKKRHELNCKVDERIARAQRQENHKRELQAAYWAVAKAGKEFLEVTHYGPLTQMYSDAWDNLSAALATLEQLKGEQV